MEPALHQQMMNGNDDELSSPLCPQPPETGRDIDDCSPVGSGFAGASSFIRNSARKSLGDGLSMQKWVFAHEKVREQYGVGVGILVLVFIDSFSGTYLLRQIICVISIRQ